MAYLTYIYFLRRLKFFLMHVYFLLYHKLINEIYWVYLVLNGIFSDLCCKDFLPFNLFPREVIMFEHFDFIVKNRPLIKSQTSF